MKLYHGTDKGNLNSIIQNGLIAQNGIIGNPNGIPKYIYFTDNLELAKQYGDLIIEVETDDFEEKFGTFQEGIGLVYHYLGDIPPSKLNEVEEKEKVFCEKCQDTGQIEIIGDGANFEVDVIGYKRCSCQDD